MANQKGGAGKTTATVHIAIALARLGHRVLLVDMDGQGNATTYLGLEKNGLPLLEVLMGHRELVEAVEKTEHGVDVLGGGPELEGLDVVLYMQKRDAASFLLKQRLDAAQNSWDFILIDCPPNLGTATTSALLAAEEVLVPVQAEGMAVEGLGRLAENIELAKTVNANLRIVGVLSCMTNPRETLTQQIEAMLRESYGELVFSASVKRNTRIAQSYLLRQPIHVFDRKNAAVKSFDSVAREIVSRGEVTA